MNAPPSFQFYASDFVGGTMSFDAEQAGAYILLLCYQWMNGKIPDDEAAQAVVGRCSSTALAVVRKKFAQAPDGSGLINVRLEEVRTAQNRYRAKQSENGRKGGLLSKHRSSTATSDATSGAQATLKPESSSPISDLLSPIVSTESTAQAPLPNCIVLIPELHQVWQQRTGLEANPPKLFERDWFEFLKCGWRQPDLELVIEHSKVLNKGREEQYHTPLALGRLIGEPKKFADRLMEARAWEKAGRPLESRKESKDDPKKWTEKELMRYVTSS